MRRYEGNGRILAGIVAAALAGCGGDSSSRESAAAAAESCMLCHNGTPDANDYGGPGIENPHPFPGADQLRCTTCHGGDGDGEDRDGSHVPPPPEIGDRENWDQDREAYFNRLTLTGLDKLPDYDVGGRTYTALDYLQFVNPGDLRVVTEGRGCGLCHDEHAEDAGASLLATEAGIFSGAMYAAGVENQVPANAGLWEDTAADLAFRAVQDAAVDASRPGAVGELLEYPVFSVRGDTSPGAMFQNPDYDAATLASGLNPDNSLQAGSPLANLYHEQVAFTCGDCHLGSAGANNRYGDFRSSGCTACHMPYSLSGRSGSGDPNVDPDEPADPDDIDDPELPHVRRHMILSRARRLPGGEPLPGIDDHTCAGCHQGSNRTVMQYWGIRLDQNQDVRRGRQYPADPVSWQSTSGDERLFDPAVGNNTFNGRNRFQYLLFEDYDGDGRDDTPPDVHYEAGLGCIDCHGSYELHGGDTSEAGADVVSRMEHGVAIRCESCHGGVDAYAETREGTTYDGMTAQLAVDAEGNLLRHVEKEADGEYWLTSRLTGERHFVVQTFDTIVDSGKLHPETMEQIYSVKASYAMGRADGNVLTGIGPRQNSSSPTGFSHADNVSCAACHASWTNNCTGCHLEGEYDNGQNFSNITGQRIVFREKNADFVYQSPVPFQLGVGPDNEVDPICPNTKTFFRYEDADGDRSQVFAFTDRNGGGNNPARATFPSLSHNVMMPHSIRGKVTDEGEGPRYCVACHLTTKGLQDFGAEYDDFRTKLAAADYGQLDFELLQDHIGSNPGNQMNSPLWVHMVAGLGSGLYLFDEHGCPVNPLDDDSQRKGCDGVAPASVFDAGRVVFDLDRIVDDLGAPTGSSNHALLAPGEGPELRDGGWNANLAGPLGLSLIERLTDPDPGVGIVLDSWLDADGQPGGGAGSFLPGP